MYCVVKKRITHNIDISKHSIHDSFSHTLRGLMMLSAELLVLGSDSHQDGKVTHNLPHSRLGLGEVGGCVMLKLV